VSGPKDVITEPGAGALSEDLRAAALAALKLDRKATRAHALRYSWEHSAQQFIENMLAAHHIGLPERKRRWRRKKKAARLGGNRAAHSHASVWGTLGGSRVPPEMVSEPQSFKEPRPKNLAE
jgi:hypothetical protein